MPRSPSTCLLALCLFASTAHAVDGNWTASAVRYYKTGAACAFDTDNNRLLVMGGHSFSAGQASDQLWAFDFDGIPGWSVLPLNGPTPGSRAGANMLFDAPRHRLLVYGGHRVETGEFLGDLWARRLDGDFPWELLHDGAGGPSARMDACLAIDTERDQLVLFGGRGAAGLGSDAWTLPLSGLPVWTALAPSGTPPSPRSRAQMAYDPPRDRMVIHGGHTGAQFTNDLYLLGLEGSPAWSGAPGVLSSLTDPALEHTYAMSYDETADAMRLIGGSAVSAGIVQKLQLSPSLAWSGVATGGSGPNLRLYQLVAHDPVGHRDVLYGGFQSVITASPRFATDVYALSGGGGGTPSWTRFVYPCDKAPISRSGAAFVYDAPRDRFVTLGGAGNGEAGSGGGAAGNAAYKLGLNPIAAWSTPVSGEVRRVDFAYVHDVIRNRIVQIGGRRPSDSVVLSSVASFNLVAETWVTLSPTGVFPPTAGIRAVHDVPRDRVIVLDPQVGSLWELPFLISPVSPPWTPIVPSTTGPSARSGAMVVRDPVRDRMLVLGGGSPGSGLLDEMWAFTLSGPAEWTQVPLSGTSPLARSNGVLVYDSNRDRLVLFGGKSPSGQLLNDAWQLPLDGSNQWAELVAAGSPPAGRDFPSGVFDPGRDRIAIWGGDTSNVVPMDPLGELYFLAFTALLAVDPVTTRPTLAFSAGPNPAREVVAIRLARPAAANTRVAVLDLAGRVLREARLPEGALEWRWDEAAPPGIYFVRIETDRESATRRIVRL